MSAFEVKFSGPFSLDARKMWWTSFFPMLAGGFSGANPAKQK